MSPFHPRPQTQEVVKKLIMRTTFRRQHKNIQCHELVADVRPGL